MVLADLNHGGDGAGGPAGGRRWSAAAVAMNPVAAAIRKPLGHPVEVEQNWQAAD